MPIISRPQVVPLPETLLDSCWKVVLELRGVKSNKNRVPIRLTFSCKFSADDNILEVEPNHRFVKRYVVASFPRRVVDTAKKEKQDNSIVQHQYNNN